MRDSLAVLLRPGVMKGRMEIFPSHYGGLGASADGMVGSRTNVEAKLTFDPKGKGVMLNTGIEHYEGAVGTLNGGYRNDWFNAEAQLIGTIGTGGKAGLSAGFKNGVLQVNADLFGSYGLGGGGGIKLGLNLYNIYQSASSAVDDAITAVMVD